MIKKNMLKKLLISIVFAIYLLTSVFVSQVKAKEDIGPWYSQSFEQWAAKVFDKDNPQEIFGERYTYAQVTWILHSLEAFQMGDDLIHCTNISNDLTELKDCVEGIKEKSGSMGPIMTIASIGDSILATPPASGIKYLADTASKLHLIPETYAQGAGFKALQPAQVIWKVSRNITYALLIFAIIIMAFMIMFRVKISPQTVITIQSALPRMIMILILITFSYAIAGFIIDLSYLILGAIAAFVTSVGTNITSLSFFDFFNKFLFGSSLFWSLVGVLIVYLAAIIILGAGIGAILTPVTAGASAAGGAAVGGVIAIIVLLVLFITGLRILWLLIKTTINILLSIIVAPFIILLGIFPAIGGLGPWLKNFVANVAVFPMVRIMFLLSHYFFWGITSTDANILSGADFNPLGIIPTGSESSILPGYMPFETSGTGILGWIISFGIFLLIPSAGNMIKSIIQGQPFTFGAAIGKTFGPIPYTFGPIGRVAGKIPGGAKLEEYFGALQNLVESRGRPRRPIADEQPL